MDNHAHLLLTPRDTPLAPWLATLKRRFVQSLADWRGGRFWLRGGGFDRMIWTVDEFEEKFRYIHLNPVRAGITRDPVRYRWSSAHDWFIRPRDGAPKLAERPAELSAIFP
jgi:putative transposase